MNESGLLYYITDSRGTVIKCADAIAETADIIKEGKIVALKGIGGFHLCCDAFNAKAIDELRKRKNRPHKPFALMAANIDVLRDHCTLSDNEPELLTSSKRPIVLLKKNENSTLPDCIAPGLRRLGVMLPYFPLHNLLFNKGLEFLIMTSGNTGGAPIQYKDDEVILHLNGVADFFLFHDRNIHNPIDDSVVKFAAGKEMVGRRGRGYIPFDIKLSESDSVLALGAEEKSSICLSKAGYAYMSRYLGDLKDLNSYDLFIKTIDDMTSLYQLKPKIYAHDFHPQYLSARYAMEQQGRRVAVQHHHAHMVSCMVEHNLYDNTIGVIFDGTGLGSDGSIWGGEFLLGNIKGFKRIGHLKPVILQGGDKAIKEPWRCAAAYLYSLGYEPEDYLEQEKIPDITVIKQALASNLNCYLSTSMGRLFDCVAALIGLRQVITYDAQAAIELENIAASDIDDQSYSYSIYENSNDLLELDYRGIISDLLIDKKYGTSASIMSARFHNTISESTVDMLLRLRNKYHINQIVLSGGVFENTYLLESAYQKLKKEGFSVYFNGQIPINDSGISVGQLAIANEYLGG